ncbi:MAG: DoxX family protein [bacterium]|nr:DoxX family protein [bacterium]MDZ4285737.1 DoxX family protein [Candidatus Sungbacteria bacterium]
MNLLASIHSYGDFGLLILRFGLAVIFLVHGRRKQIMWKMQSSPQMSPTMLSLMRFLSIAEPLAAAAVIFGLLTQLAALGMACVMVSAIFLKITKWNVPFINKDMSPGWEFDFIILASALSLFFTGAGALSLDRLILGL